MVGHANTAPANQKQSPSVIGERVKRKTDARARRSADRSLANFAAATGPVFPRTGCSIPPAHPTITACVNFRAAGSARRMGATQWTAAAEEDATKTYTKHIADNARLPIFNTTHVRDSYVARITNDWQLRGPAPPAAEIFGFAEERECEGGGSL